MAAWGQFATRTRLGSGFWRRSARAWLVLASIGALSVLGVGACQLVLDVDGVQCAADRDCVGLFGRGYSCSAARICVEQASTSDAGTRDARVEDTLPPEWACIRGPKRMVIPRAGQVVELSLGVTDFVTLEAPPDLMGIGCNAQDISCMNPIDTQTPDDQGYLVFSSVPHGWRGFFILSAPGYLDTLVFSNRAYGANAMPGGPTLITERTLRDIAEGGGEEVDETRGLVLIAVYDCDGNAAPGITFVQVDDDNDEDAFYFEGTLPDRDRKSTSVTTQLTRTMVPLAVGGFSKVSVGYQTFIGLREDTREEIGRVTVTVRALTMTIAELHAGY